MKHADGRRCPEVVPSGILLVTNWKKPVHITHDSRLARITTRNLSVTLCGGRCVPLLRAVHVHTHGRARENERGREERERTRAASGTARWCGDQGGCTGCLDDHRVMSLEAWRPAAAADDNPEAAFPAGGSRPVIAPLAASPLRPNSRREFASSSCVARAVRIRRRRLPVNGDGEFRSTFGKGVTVSLLSLHCPARSGAPIYASTRVREYASQISREGHYAPVYTRMRNT